MEIKVETENGKARLFTPYHPDFVKAVRQIGGARWDGELKCWTIPESCVDAAREIMTGIYGRSDIGPDDTTTLRIRVLEQLSARRTAVTLLGKTLASASGRDSGARAGDDVAYVKGGPASGGSMRNWTSEVEAGSEIILYDVSRRLLENFVSDGSVEVEPAEGKTGRDKLVEERRRLLERVAEIDRLLAADAPPAPAEGRL